MKILFCAWNIVGEADMIASLRKLGHEVEVYVKKIESVDYDLGYIKELSEILEKALVDCVFSTDFVPVISRVCNIYKMPYISWTVDCPMIMLYSETVRNSCNFIFLFDWNMYQKWKDINPGHVFYMPLGGNVERMDAVPFTDRDKKKYQTDVSFVGSLYMERNKYSMVYENWSPYIQGIADGLVEVQMLLYGQNIFEETVSTELGERIFDEAQIAPVGSDYFIDKREIVVTDILPLKCTQLERVRMLNAIAEYFSLDLYTKQDADAVPKAKAKGTVDYNTEMLSVFRASKINLNFTSKGIQTGLPLRIFDIMGAGGFLITNYQTEIPEFFENGKDLVCYESKQDLLEKISYYLNHEEEREEIARNGYLKVKEHMQMYQRMEDIFAILNSLK